MTQLVSDKDFFAKVVAINTENPDCDFALGIDPSLTSTGIALAAVDPKTGEVAGTITTTIRTKADAGPFGRIKHIHEAISLITRATLPDVYVIEGYAYGARNGRETAGEVRGAIYLALEPFTRMFSRDAEPGTLLWDSPTLVVTPNHLKKFATGNAKGDKDLMRLAVYKRWGFEAPSNDEVDAYILSRIGVLWLCEKPPAGTTAAQDEVLTAITAEKKKGKRKGKG